MLAHCCTLCNINTTPILTYGQCRVMHATRLYAAQRNDGGLGTVHQRRGEHPADAADVAQRQRAAGHVLLRQPPCHSQALQPGTFAGFEDEPWLLCRKPMLAQGGTVHALAR